MKRRWQKHSASAKKRMNFDVKLYVRHMPRILLQMHCAHVVALHGTALCLQEAKQQEEQRAAEEKAQAALEACKETLETLRKFSPVTPDNLESAKRVVMNRHEGELRSSSYWTKLMSGIQEESIPLKGPLSVTDFNAVVNAITVKDLQLSLECFGIDDSELYTAIGRTVVPEGYVPDDEIVKASPMAGMGRGGALMG